MKKKLICLLTLISLFVATLATAAIVYADGIVIADNYSITNAEGKISSSEGGIVHATAMKDADMITMYFNEEKSAVQIPENSYIHVKGVVSSDIYRIKVFVNGAETISRLFDAQAGGGEVDLQADGTFEWHYSANSLFWAHPDDAQSLGFQIYVVGRSGGSTNESLEFLGVVINNEESYDGFATPSTPVEPEPEDPNPEEPTNAIEFGAPAVASGDATLADGVFTFTADDSVIEIPVSNCTAADMRYFSMQYAASGAFSIEITVNGLDSTGNAVEKYVAAHNGWNVTTEEYEACAVKTAKIGSYLDEAAITAVTSVVIVCTPEAEGSTIKFIDFAATTDGQHGFDVSVTPDPEPDPEPEDPNPEEPTGELAFGAPAVASGDATLADGVFTFTADDSVIEIPVSNCTAADMRYLSMQYAASGDFSIEITVKGIDSTGNAVEKYVAAHNGWNVTTEEYDSCTIKTATIGSYLDEAGMTAVSSILLSCTPEAEGATIKFIDFDATTDGKYDFVVQKPAIEGIVTKADVAIEKDASTGYQTLTYSVTPGWHDLSMTVNEFDATKTYAKLTFSHENAEAINLYYIIDGNEMKSIGWKAYGKGEHVEYISLDGMNLVAPWTFAFFLDSNEEITAEKTVVIHSLEFVGEEDLPAAPTGLYFTATTEGGITCTANQNGGWDVSWNNDTESWRNVTLVINNYETDYDILKLNISATAGTNIGIRWHYVIFDEDGETPLHARVRTHDGYEGIVGETGELQLVYLAKAFNMQGLVQTKVEIWFDCPTGTSTNVGAQSATINSIELLKSSEITFQELVITAPEMVVDYTGEAVALAATSAPEATLVVEYEVLDNTTGRMVWTKSAPSAAGVYNVRVKFMGSLVHDYTVVNSKLTINKIAAVTNEGDVVIDPETRVVTVAEGVVASFAEDFAEGLEVLTGDEIPYGAVIYYFRDADANHTAGQVLSITFNRPVEPETCPGCGSETIHEEICEYCGELLCKDVHAECGNSETSAPETSAPATSAPVTSAPEKVEEKEPGCLGSIATMGVEATILMMGAIVAFIRKRK